MALPSLTGTTPADTRGFILHVSNATLANAPIYTGDGRQTPITLRTGGITITGDVMSDTATFNTSLSVGGITVHPAIWQRLTNTITATDTNQVPLTPLEFIPVSGAVYELELLIIGSAVALAGALQIVNTGGAGSLTLMDSATALGIQATGGSYAPAVSPVAGIFVIVLKGIFVPTTTDPLKFSIKSDDTNDVSALPNSYLRRTRIA